MRKETEQEPQGISEHTGFPNPATGTSLRSLDLNRLLISHSASTYFFTVRGNEWQAAGVFDGDIAIIDRALDPHKADTVVWWDEHHDSFVISAFRNVPAEATLWGVITAVIHQFRKIKNKP